MNEATIIQIKQDFKTEFPDEGKVIYPRGFGKSRQTMFTRDLRCWAYVNVIKHLEQSDQKYSITEARQLVDEAHLSLVDECRRLMDAL